MNQIQKSQEVPEKQHPQLWPKELIRLETLRLYSKVTDTCENETLFRCSRVLRHLISICTCMDGSTKLTHAARTKSLKTYQPVICKT